MKLKFLFVCAVLLPIHTFAQTINIHFKNGTKVEFHNDLIDHVDFSEKPSDPTLTAGEAVDLGLSVMWASCNLGATKASEYGNYYAWGETSPKSSYSKSNYSYYDSSTESLKGILTEIAGTEYDAATVNLGNEWRMPSKEELQELITNCTWTKNELDGVVGYYVTGKNGNCIFLPAGGTINGTYQFEKGSNLDYWTSTYSGIGYSHDPTTWVLLGKEISTQNVFWGRNIRPIISYDDYNGTSDYDDTHVTSKVSSYYAGGSIMSNGNTILSGSKLNFYFKNGSSEDVELTGIQLVNGSTNEVGNNLLNSNVVIAAGESSGYAISVGASGILSPKCRFTYRYNNHTYTTEAAYQSYNFVKGKTVELFDE